MTEYQTALLKLILQQEELRPNNVLYRLRPVLHHFGLPYKKEELRKLVEGM